MKKIIYLLLISGMMTSCSDGSEKATENVSNETVRTSSKTAGTGICLADKDHKYEELLTKTDISKHVSIDESSFKQKISSPKGKYGACVYSWESDRPETEMEVSGKKFKRPDRNQITIKMLYAYTDRDLKRYEQEGALALFDQSYKKLSQEEYDQILSDMEKKLSTNPKAIEDAKKMMDSRLKFTYEPVEKLGDRAYWKWNNNFGIELIVSSIHHPALF